VTFYRERMELLAPDRHRWVLLGRAAEGWDVLMEGVFARER
jgi:hypothetical protein